MLTLKAKVELLNTAVLTNNVQDVQALFAKHHQFEFTARAFGLAMRFCGADMVAALNENGATLSFLPTEKLLQTYLTGFPAFWGGRSYDFAKYLFPAIGPVPDDADGREPISATQRQVVIEYLVSQNIPELPSFLYYSILAGDSTVYDYLRANNFACLASPYVEIVQGQISQKEVKRLKADNIVEELREQINNADDAKLAIMLERLKACVPHNISIMRYRLLLRERANHTELFPFLAQHSDLTSWPDS